MDLGEDQIYAFRQSARTMGSSLIVVLEVVYKDVTRHQGHYFPMSIALISSHYILCGCRRFVLLSTYSIQPCFR
jgi:hypothetical protein